MNAVIMDEAVIGDECIIGALSFVKAKEVFEKRSLIVGNPAKKIKEVSDEMIAWKTQGTALYQVLPSEMRLESQAVEALTEIPKDRPEQENLFKIWKEIKKRNS